MEKHKKTGEKLENGYVIILNNGAFVLAHNEKKREYATWKISMMGDTVFGHYFNYWYCPKDEAHIKAFNDYTSRSKEGGVL